MAPMRMNAHHASRYSYLYQGYHLVSDFELHALPAMSSVSNELPVLHLLRGQPPQTQSLPRTGEWLKAAGCFGFDIDDIGRFVVVEGDRIFLAMSAEGQLTHAEQVLLGSAFAIAMMQRQQFCLHAAVLSRGGRTIAFCGDSGEGKSTLAMTLAEAGWSVLTDDLALVRVIDDAVRIENNGRHLRLWRTSLEAMGREVEQLVRISQHEDKYYVEAPLQASAESLPLDAICVLGSEAADAEYRLESISGMAALAQLRRHTYRHELLPLLGCDAAHLQHCAALSARVPLYRLWRPRSLSRLGELAPFLDAGLPAISR